MRALGKQPQLDAVIRPELELDAENLVDRFRVRLVPANAALLGLAHGLKDGVCKSAFHLDHGIDILRRLLARGSDTFPYPVNISAHKLRIPAFAAEAPAHFLQDVLDFGPDLDLDLDSLGVFGRLRRVRTCGR